jgi:2,3-bisphosphoglycerate-dependent phosphoglycerate mutase
VARVLLVRHCESLGPAPDAGLTPRGRAQAERLAERLVAHPIDHIVSSPYLRARLSVAPLASRTGLGVHVDGRLAERRISSEPVHNGRDVVERSFRDADHRLPGGESGAEALARGLAAVLSGGHRLPVVASHGQLFALVLHSVDPGFGYAGWQSLRNPDVLLLEVDAGRSVFSRIAE